MTGITRVSRESIFSDLNNLTVATVTSDLYCTCFGFTEEEVWQGNVRTKIAVEDFLKGGYLETEIDDEIVFNQLSKKWGAIWSLLLASGYLKVAKRSFSAETGRFMYRLELTNMEVQMMFENMIRDWFDNEDEESLEETVAAALKQIREKAYDSALNARGIPN